jgi:hypothetical protein
MSEQPLMTFKSHIEGKNADVSIYADRVEWGQKSRVTRRSSSEVIPIKHVSSVTVHRDGFRQAVKVICSGNTIDFRVGRGEAEAIKTVLVDLMLGKHPTQQAPTSSSSPMPPPPPPSPSV